MIAAEHPDTKISEPYPEGSYYEGHMDVQVEIPSIGAKYKKLAVSPQDFDLEVFLLELDVDQEKKKQLCKLIEAYGWYQWKEGSDSERESQSY